MQSPMAGHLELRPCQSSLAPQDGGEAQRSLAFAAQALPEIPQACATAYPWLNHSEDLATLRRAQGLDCPAADHPAGVLLRP